MAKHRLVGIVAVLVLLAAAVPATAQTTGSIRGSTADQQGAALPGVMVTLTSELLGGSEPTAISGARGAYIFAGLTPGRYTVTAALEGFQSQQSENVRVAIDGVATVNFDMQVALTEEIMVTAEAPLLDSVSPTVGTNYDAEFVKDLPTRRNFFDLVTTSPGVEQPREELYSAFRISAFGADVTSGAWNIDGVNMTAPEGGYLFFNLNPDVIVETQVIGFGAGAEYGSMSGTVYNFVTKSGSNEFHGSAGIVYGSDDLTWPNVTLPDLGEAAEFHTNKFLDASFTLGGPILKDQLWFFAGYQNAPLNETTPREDPALVVDTTRARYDLKLSARLAEGHRAEVKVGYEDQYHPWTYDTSVIEESAWKARTLENLIFSGEYTGTLTPNTLLQVRGGWWKGNNGDLTSSTSTDTHLRNFDMSPTHQSGGPYWEWWWVQRHKQLDVVLSQFADDFIKGDHEFKFGVQYNSGGGDSTTYNTFYNYIWGGYLYSWSVTPYIYGGTTTSLSGFATDSWKIGERFSIDLGVRYDRHDARIPEYDKLDVDSNPTGTTIPEVEMFVWNQISPRLGFVWQATDDGKTVVRGSTGVFYQGTVSGNWYAPAPGRDPWVYGYYDSAGNNITWKEVPGGDLLLQPDMKGPRTTEYTLGVERQIGADIAVGLQGIYKQTKDGVGWQLLDDGDCSPFNWTDGDTGVTHSLFDCAREPTARKGNSTGPGALGGDRNYEQDYKGVIVTFKKRFSDGWDMMASYTWSKAEGLANRALSGGGGGQGGAFWSGNSEAHPNLWGNIDGLLSGDRTHAFRVSGNVDLPAGFKLSGILNLQTGHPTKLIRRVSYPSGGNFQMISVPNSDDNRMPAQTVIDLGFGKRFSLGEKAAFNLDLQLMNLLNEDAVTGYQTLQPGIGNDYVPGSWVFPRRLRIRAKLDF